MALTLVVTAAGRAALVNAAHDGTAPVRIAAVGVSAQAIVASAATAALPGEIKRIVTLSGDVVAADTIHLIVRDETDASYTVRSLALYLADGTLFGAYGQAGVIVEKSVQALLLLAIDVRFADIAASQISFGSANFLNPPATVERQGVVELATEEEARTATDTQRAVTPRTAAAAVLSWIGYRPLNRAGDTATGLLSIRASGINSGVRLQNVNTGREYRVIQKDDGWFHITDENNLAERISIGPLGQVLVNAAAVVTLGTDGAGSGVDADLLDGQQGSWYADIRSRLGYTPLDKAGDTATGLLSIRASGINSGIRLQNVNTGREYRVIQKDDGWFHITDENNLAERISIGPLGQVLANGAAVVTLGNDGAGSGVDADLLDGQQGSWYADVKARLGYDPANKAGETFTGTVATGGDFYLSRMSDAWGYILRPNVDGYRNLAFAAATGATLDQVDANAHLLTRRGSKVWDAGNDGAGSGLDADLLDGQDSAFYRDIPARLGYVPLDVNSYTPNEIIARTMQVDGSGSGLDADLLDGQQGSWYADVAARLGFVPANRAGQIFDGPIGPEAGFQMVFSAGNPGIVFTADGKSSVFFNRSTGYYTFYNNGRAVFDVDGNGNARFRGTVTQNVAF